MPLRPEFDNLFELYSREIFVYLWRMTGGTMEAEDCLQETFLRAYRAYTQLDPDSNYRAWLYKIATNVARTHWRRQQREAERIRDVGLEMVQVGHNDLEHLDRQDRWIAVKQAVMELPHKQRSALMLKKYQGLSYESVAVTLGITQAAARANVYQALKKLRQRFINETEAEREI
jgi:RNA polymerase sigma-70 factor (ECF subfamily)